MRVMSTNFSNYYVLGNNATRLSVLIYNSTQSSSRDLTALSGRDWVRQIQITDAADAPGVSGKVSLQRDVFRLSFSPLVTQSKFNSVEAAIFPGRRVQVKTATTAINFAPLAGNYIFMADLHIDTIDFAKETIELTCTDWIVALLRNTYITVQRAYGSGGLVAVETVMQGIIDDNINTPLGYTVGNGKKIVIQLPSGSPSYLITAPTIQKQSVLDAVNNLAQQNGWVLRSKWQQSSLSFQLQFYAPQRSNVTAIYTLTPTLYDDITMASISKTDIRNYIYGYYTDSATNTRQQVVVSDAPSLAKYGDPPMAMELTEAATSQINTPSQMNTLLAAALADLKDPICQYTVTMPYFYPAEVGDVYTLAANSVTHDTGQNCGVTSWTHTVGRNTVTTEMALRGQPIGSYGRWFAAEARPGVGPTANMLDPAAPSVSLVGGVGTLTVNYVVADLTNWSTTEVYISTTTFSQPAPVGGKNQRPTVLQIAKGRLTHFTLNSLIPGATYYVGICVIDRDGNVGTMAGPTALGVPTVGPFHENLAGQQDQLIRNPDLNIYSQGYGTPPDNWLFDATWSASYVDVTHGSTGALCLAFDLYNGPAIGAFANNYLISLLNSAYTDYPSKGYCLYSKAVPLPQLELLSIIAYCNGSTNGFAYLGVVQFDISMGYLAVSMQRCGGSGSYAPMTLEPVRINAAAHFGQVFLFFDASTTAGNSLIYLDRIYMNRALGYCNGALNSKSIAANTATALTLPPSTYVANNHGVTGVGPNSYATLLVSGYFTASVAISGHTTAGVGVTPPGGTATLTISCGGTVTASGSAAMPAGTAPNTSATWYLQVSSPLFSGTSAQTVTWSLTTTAACSIDGGPFSVNQVSRPDA
jgi:hypothetical protein